MRALWVLAVCATLLRPAFTVAAVDIRPQWNHPTHAVRAEVSIQVCPEPLLRPGSAIHDQLFKNLRELRADYARLQPWHPYPRLAVAELEPPHDNTTSWDFSLIDPWVEDFFAATDGHPVMLNFGEIPEWMFKSDRPLTYPTDPDAISHHYGQGAELRDPTLREIRDYYFRLASWYLKGGFVDELGRRHESGHHYKVAYWEVLNEPDLTHYATPELYTSIYDEVVTALREVEPSLRFSGLAIAWPDRPEYFEYFLDPRNHKPGIPLDMISYHFYAVPEVDESPTVQEHTFFAQADGLIANARYIDAIRKRLSPHTKVYINEVGSLTADLVGAHPEAIPGSYWNLSAAMFAYIYLRVAQLGLGIDAIAGAELIDYPGQAAGSTLSDWKTGQSNARYQVLKLLRQSLAPGDQLVDTMQSDPQLLAVQAFVTKTGSRKIVIVNKRNRPLDLHIPDGTGAHVEFVDQLTAGGPLGRKTLRSENVNVAGLGVAVVTLWPQKHDRRLN